MSKNLHQILFVIVLGLSFTAMANTFSGFSESCLETTEGFNQCTEDYNLEAIPGKKWCNVRPIRPQVRTTDFLLSELEFDEALREFRFQAVVLSNPNKENPQPPQLVGQAFGKWSLEINVMDLHLDTNLSTDPPILPSKVHVGFVGEQEGLLIFSEILGGQPMTFGSLVFTDCAELFPAQ